MVRLGSKPPVATRPMSQLRHVESAAIALANYVCEQIAIGNDDFARQQCL